MGESVVGVKNVSLLGGTCGERRLCTCMSMGTSVKCKLVLY